MKKLALIISFASALALHSQAFAAVNEDYDTAPSDSAKKIYIPAPASGDASTAPIPIGAANNGPTGTGATTASPAMYNGDNTGTPSGANQRLLEPTAWSADLDGALRRGDFNQINVIAASHPNDQGRIALYLLEASKRYGGNPEAQAKIFAAAAPFAGQIPPADADKIIATTAEMLQLAANPTFRQGNPQGASDIYYAALIVSSQPNVVAADPTLHSAVLEAADDFLKGLPADADKRLRDEVDLAEAGGAPTTTPFGTINPSQE